MPERNVVSTLADEGPSGTLEPVRKQIRVRTTAERAFSAFTEEINLWWPRTHHIGKSPMKQVIFEPVVGGAIYTNQEDGTVCPWGSVLDWEPPHRFLMAWHIRPDWTYEPDAERCSEVEVLFTAADDGTTLVELEHRYFERHGSGAAAMREAVNQDGGWGGLLALYGKQAEESL